jgi:hypothetical protein
MFQGHGRFVLFVLFLVISSVRLSAQGNALEFNGSGQYGIATGFSSFTEYTIETWIKPASISSSTIIVLSNLDGPNMSYSHRIALLSNAKVQHYFYDSAAEIHRTIDSATELQTDRWYHIAITASNGGMARLYINGVEEGTAQAVNTLWADGDRFYLAVESGPFSTYGYYGGDMDEVRIWNTQRSATDIQQTMYKSLGGRESGLEAYYTMNQTSGVLMSNQVSSDHQMTLPNGPAWVASGVPFKAFKGQALNFDGTNEYVLSDANVSNIYDNITVEAWIKPDVNLGNGKWDRLVGTGYAANWLFCGKHLSTNALNVAMGGNASVATSANNVVKVGIWQHVAFTFDNASNIVKIYHNADSVASGLYTGTFAGGARLGIARDGNIGTEYFDGQMDEVRVWSTVRTESELRENMNKRLTGTEAGLEVYYTFDATTGTKVMDMSVKGNHASTVNMDDTNWKSSDYWYLGTLAQTEGYRMLAAPASVTYATLLANVWTQGSTGGDVSNGSPNVWTWNNNAVDASSSNWTAVSNLNTSLTAGDGFLYYHFNNDDFAGNPNYYVSDVSVSGTEFTSATPTINSNVNGWTLVGNPYFTSVDWALMGKSNLYADARVWDPVSSSWKLTDSEPVIAPYQSFFVQTFASSPSLSIDSGDKVYGGTFRAKETGRFELALTASSENFRDEVMLRFYPDATAGLDIWDAIKTQPLSANFLAVSLVEGGKSWAILSNPVITEVVEIPVAVEFTQSGRVKLGVRLNALPEGWTAELLDTKTGSKITLGDAAESVYSFDHVFAGKIRDAKEIVAAPIEMKTVAENRFVLKITPANVTSNENGNLPTKLALEQNYPNPFNPSTTIRFALPQSGNVKLEVLNLLGQTVATVANGAFSAGNHAVSFDASKLASGVYLYRINAGGAVISKKMTLLK